MSGGGLQSLRARAAAAARALADGRGTLEGFMAEFGDVDDPTIAALVDLIEREPDPGGFFGVSQSAYRAYRAEVERLIAELAADA